jgi:hypothetical protein
VPEDFDAALPDDVLNSVDRCSAISSGNETRAIVKDVRNTILSSAAMFLG